MNEPVYGTPSGEPATPEEQLREAAIRSLRRKDSFKIHLLVFTVVNALLIATWMATAIGSGVWYPWWIYPFFGWGIGLVLHGWAAYRPEGLSEARIRNEMNRISNR
jgi:hypothetical protein